MGSHPGGSCPVGSCPRTVKNKKSDHQFQSDHNFLPINWLIVEPTEVEGD